MTRVCKLEGCTFPVSGPRAEFCKSAHRAAYWRTSHVVAEPVVHPRAGKNARSGSQISYRKSVELLEVWLRTRMDRPTARRQAELILRGALSERQAEHEHQRERTG